MKREGEEEKKNGREDGDSPHDKAQLIPLSLSLIVLHIINRPSRFLLWQLLQESLKLFSWDEIFLLNRVGESSDRFVVRSESEDRVGVCALQLDRVIRLEDGIVGLDSGGGLTRWRERERQGSG